jgi:uncharacterized protein YqjF (DUF2071 family)
MRRAFLTAEWNNLIMANYQVEPDILLPLLPYKTELDVYNGNHYVSLVGFLFANTRLLGARIPFHVNFEEVNLRFYVRCYDNGEWKRGTVFIKEIVPKPAISLVANSVYHEKYQTLPMRHFFQDGASTIHLGYEWKFRKIWNRIEATVSKPPHPLVPGSEEEFITEHYWGYSRYNDHTSFQYQVQHPSWKIFPVLEHVIECDFAGLYGSRFSSLASIKPKVFVARGSAIGVFPKQRL